MARTSVFRRKTLELDGFIPDNSNQIKGSPADAEHPLGEIIAMLVHEVQELKRNAGLLKIGGAI